jgi:WD40 repeat protein
MNTPVPEQASSTRATDLLSLLKFKQGTQPAASPTSPAATSTESLSRQPQSDATSGAQGRPVSAADLVAGFARKPSGLGQMQSPSALAPTASRPELRGEASASSQTFKSQDFLLKLLNHQAQPKPTSESTTLSSSVKQTIEVVPAAVVDNLARDLQDTTLEQASSSPTAAPRNEREESPMHVFGEAVAPPSSFDAEEAAKSKVFTYVNPFEQLSASSPLNRVRTPNQETAAPKVEILKHARDSSNTSGPAAKTRKVDSNSAPQSSLSTPPAAPRESVSEALKEVGEVADKQVEQALAQTTKANGDSEPKESKAEKEVREAAAEIKEELKDKKTRRDLEAGMSKTEAKAFEATIHAVAAKPAASKPATATKNAAEKASVEEDWEQVPDKDVRVYNFPMRPFITIDIKQLGDGPLPISPDSHAEIARIKKDFDQIDRNMVSGSSNFMVYPLKHGGFRAIKQDDGSHKQVFANHKERIFNIALSHTHRGAGMTEIEAVLATGVDGTVFWAPLANFAQDESFGQSEEERGFAFPPVPTNDENTSGGQLKTRVKPSSRHPEYFGYGRGKSIYIVFPGTARTAAYTNPKSRVCDSNKYLKEHTLRVSTGKAGKDFVFSADDTVIVSLDKAGRLKFWDVRPLVGNASLNMPIPTGPVEVKVPLMTLTTCLPNEKSWPTSVMLLDKEKPMAKGIALRYVIIGLKQNHTLQIWDLALGKPVEEINFPHEQESDAICSLAYHPKTGILAVGHPTRNSVYLLHVSAPQYNLPPLSQAKFIQMLASKDQSLPSPASTVIISGVREYTLGDKGTIRSLDMLNDPDAQFADGPAFVLYIMHSKGISEMRVTRQHLGWSETGKILNPVNAQKIGAIVVGDIRPLPPPVAGDAISVTSESPAAVAIGKNGKEEKRLESTPSRDRKPPVVEQTPKPETANGEKPEKKKKKDKKVAEATSQTTSTATSFIQPPEVLSRPTEAEPPKSPSPTGKAATRTPKASEPEIPAWAVRLLENSTTSTPAGSSKAPSVATGVETLLTNEFENLYRKIGDDKRVAAATGAAQQEAVLRLVSSTLADNVEGALNRAVTDGLTKITTNPLKQIVTSTIDRNLGPAVNQTVQANLPRELEKAVPVAVSKVLQDANVLRGVADVVSAKVAQQIDGYLSATIRETIVPSFTSLALNAANQMSGEIERRFIEQLRQADAQQQRDNIKIDHLLKTVNNLTQIVHTMAEEQIKFQQNTNAMLQQALSQGLQTDQRQQKGTTSSSSSRSIPQTPANPPQPEKTERELELEQIGNYLAEEDFENATIKVSVIQACRFHH